VVTLIALASTRDRYRPGPFLIYIVLLGATLRSARNLSIFCLVAVLLLADHLRVPTFRSDHVTSRLPIRITASLLALVAASYFCAQAASTGFAFQATAEKTNYPRAAVSYLAENHLPPKILNDYTFGGYMIWRLYPEYQVYVDGRADLYGDEFLMQYVEIYNATFDPRPFLDQNRINTVIVAPSTGLATAMQSLTALPDWRLEYRDDRAVIFVRNNPI
jgi:hypothetical protein